MVSELTVNSGVVLGIVPDDLTFHVGRRPVVPVVIAALKS